MALFEEVQVLTPWLIIAQCSKNIADACSDLQMSQQIVIGHGMVTLVEIRSGLVNRRKKSRFFDMLSCYHISNLRNGCVQRRMSIAFLGDFAV